MKIFSAHITGSKPTIIPAFSSDPSSNDIGDGSPVVDINYSQMLEITKESDDWPGSNGRQQQSMSPFERFGNVLPTFDTPEGEEAKPGHPLGDPFTLFGLGQVFYAFPAYFHASSPGLAKPYFLERLLEGYQ